MLRSFVGDNGAVADTFLAIKDSPRNDSFVVTGGNADDKKIGACLPNTAVLFPFVSRSPGATGNVRVTGVTESVGSATKAAECRGESSRTVARTSLHSLIKLPSVVTNLVTRGNSKGAGGSTGAIVSSNTTCGTASAAGSGSAVCGGKDSGAGATAGSFATGGKAGAAVFGIAAKAGGSVKLSSPLETLTASVGAVIGAKLLARTLSDASVPKKTKKILFFAINLPTGVRAGN
jgi:hypothetical protein